jgi:hypothetical protein
LRLRGASKAPVVGFIQPGTEVLVTDSARADWAGVLPKGLGIVAPGGSQFWVPAALVLDGEP